MFNRKTTAVNVESASKLPKKRYFWLATILSIILSVIFSVLFAKGYLNYYHQSSLAEVNGRSVTYSIKQQKIISQPSVIKIDIPAEPKILIEKNKEQDPAKVELNTEAKIKEDTNISAANINEDDKKPKVSLLIAGVGLSASSTVAVLKLPAKVAIGVSPYAEDTELLAKKFTDLRHEIIINLPMEPSNYPVDDAGPYALLTSLSDKDNLERLDFLLSLINNASGCYSIDNERFTINENSLKPILEEISKKDILYVYGGDTGNNTVNQLAGVLNFPIINSDSIIDKVITEEAIYNELNLLIKKAKKYGYAVAIANPYPLTINILEKWLANLDSQGVELVGLKDIVNLIKKGKKS
jgi:polysaccharide deacetylase 2 family uncharacterized protein YibQ